MKKEYTTGEYITEEYEDLCNEFQACIVRINRNQELLKDYEIFIKDHTFRKKLKKISVGFLLISIALGPLLVLELGITASFFNTCVMSVLSAGFSNLLLGVGVFLARELYRNLKNKSASYGISLKEAKSLKEHLEKSIKADDEQLDLCTAKLKELSCLEDNEYVDSSIIIEKKRLVFIMIF